MSLIRSYRELDVYQNPMELTMRIFELTKQLKMAGQPEKWLINPRSGEYV